MVTKHYAGPVIHFHSNKLLCRERAREKSLFHRNDFSNIRWNCTYSTVAVFWEKIVMIGPLRRIWSLNHLFETVDGHCIHSFHSITSFSLKLILFHVQNTHTDTSTLAHTHNTCKLIFMKRMEKKNNNSIKKSFAIYHT